MTTEIEKELMQKYQCKPKYQDRCALEDRCKDQGILYSDFEKKCPFKMNCTDNCKDAYTLAIYPPITAEKILRLEEFVLNKYGNVLLNKAQDDYPYQYETKDLFTDWYKTKTEAICALLYGIYTDLTPQERNEVKEILEG